MNLKNILTALMLAFLMLSGTAYANDKIDVNRASVEQLQEVKGIGAKTAAAIVAYREEHGAFKSVQDLKKVKGIGDKKLSKIERYIKVSNHDKKMKDKDKKGEHRDKNGD